jgi:hypothetical protein
MIHVTCKRGKGKKEKKDEDNIKEEGRSSPWVGDDHLLLCLNYVSYQSE